MHKYEVKMERFSIDLPYHTFLHVAEQQGIPQMWLLVEPESKFETYDFIVRGTGHPVCDDETWLGTWQSPPFIWHLFKRDL